MDGIHLLLGDAALLAGLVHLGACKDHEAVIDLGELGVVLRGGIRRLTSLRDRLLGLVLLVEGAANVAPNGGVVFEEVLRLPPWNGQGASSTFLKCCQQG